MEGKYFAALDVGGTKIYTVIANTKLQILARQQIPTAAAAGPDAVIEQMLLSLQQTMTEAKIKKENLQAVGVCIAGFYDYKSNVLINSPNLKGWDNIRLADILTFKTGLPVVVENDANAAALGEVFYGAGLGHSNVIYITVSTGIGSGLILDNRLYRGEVGIAGEFGHMVIEPEGPLCGCGKRGCLEALASGTAIAKQAQADASAGNSTSLKTLAAQKNLTAKEVFTAAAQNDQLAQNIIKKAFFYLGIGIVNIINLLNPSAIVLGGGIINNTDKTLFQSLQKTIKKRVSTAAQTVKIKRAILGTEAGVKGMLHLLQEEISNARFK
ncbi:MAG: ROK family protein [Firmicutes bacterium]|nr:ROK family protein [Bacillota bacterium]